MSVLFETASVGPAEGRTLTKIPDFRFVMVDWRTRTVAVQAVVSSQSEI
jgi:hypothetical protein